MSLADRFATTDAIEVARVGLVDFLSGIRPSLSPSPQTNTLPDHLAISSITPIPTPSDGVGTEKSHDNASHATLLELIQYHVPHPCPVLTLANDRVVDGGQRNSGSLTK